MRVLAIISGVILLLPGLCALVSMRALHPGSGGAAASVALGALWIICFAISLGGIVLILRAWRRPPPW